jgi:hypothetical protein
VISLRAEGQHCSSVAGGFECNGGFSLVCNSDHSDLEFRPMIRSVCAVVLLLLVRSLVLGQEGRPPQNTEGARPCTLHPVNRRICLSEGVLRGLLMRYVPPKLPEGADENGEVLLHVIVPRTGGKPANISATSGDPALMRSATRAVREWVFMPYRYEGKEVEMEGDLHIRFKPAQ